MKLLGGGVLDLSNEFNVDILDVAGHLEADGRLFVIQRRVQVVSREIVGVGFAVEYERRAARVV